MTSGIDHVADATMATVAEIYETQFAFVWRNLRRLGVRDAALEDAAHDVFLVVIRRLSQFEGRSALRTWIFGIVHNVALDYRRRRAKDGLEEANAEFQASAYATPEESRQVQESLLLLNHLLSKLELEQRTVFIMIDVEELSAPEAALALGVKLNTIYSRLRLARRAFDTALQRIAPKQQK